MPQSYKTHQRSCIEECIKSAGDRHLTVDDIINLLNARGESVGRTTVYRTLERLEKENRVRHYAADKRQSDCYQYITDGCREHFHLKCVNCGRLFHLSCAHLNEVYTHISDSHGFCVDRSKTIFYGVCKDCGGKNE